MQGSRCRMLVCVIVFLSCLGAIKVYCGDEPEVLEEIVLDEIWSAVRVGFCLLTHENTQYAAYYNSDRRTVVAMRKLGQQKFVKQVLPSESDEPPRRSKVTSTIQGWDSHNYLTMAVDEQGHVHLSGNMHVDPLLYFRTEKPGDITSMVQVKLMVGRDEDRCTYPKFMKGPDGSLIFHYRDGSSGNGLEIHNVYDAKKRKWRRLLDKPLISGFGKMNAYQRGPSLGPDGWYYLVWMWRDTPDAATNHDISCARSRDLIKWENMAGEVLELPINIKSPGTIIDPVPAGGGMINSCFAHSFDSKNRLVVSYHKHDDKGNTQAYAARYVEGKWMVKAVSDWEGKHIFKGGGSGPSTYGTFIALSAVKQHGDGKLAIPFRHWKEGRGSLVFDEETFDRLGVDSASRLAPRHPAALRKVQSKFPGMAVRWASDKGESPDSDCSYYLRWESLGSNRDRPREGDLPPNAKLVLYKIRNAD